MLRCFPELLHAVAASASVWEEAACRSMNSHQPALWAPALDDPFLDTSSLAESQGLLHRPPSVIHSDLTRILLICLNGRLHTQPVGRTTLHPGSGLNSMYWNFLCLVLALTLLRGPQGLLWILWGPRVINSPAAIVLCSPVNSNFSGAHLSKCKFNKDTKRIIKSHDGKILNQGL